MWGPWKDWGHCKPNKGTCGDGTSKRLRKVKQQAACGGKNCEGPCEQIKPCSTCCPKNCVWSPWQDWSSCSKTCGSGTQSRHRQVTEQPSCGGKCDGEATDTKKCDKCCPENCRWGDWSKWSCCKFNKGKCGVGISTRTRKKVKHASCGGEDCDGARIDKKICAKCCPVNCKWNPWSDWSTCEYENGKCGNGISTRTRTIGVNATCKGKQCTGKDKETKKCHTCCPRDCKWKPWSDWSKCRYKKGSCGEGISRRTRTYSDSASCGGAQCEGDKVETKDCFKCCPQNCKWDKWTDWSECYFENGKCGKGKAVRTRIHAVPATCGGKECTGKSEDSKTCSTCCPRDCEWKPWSDWSKCRFKHGNCGEGMSKRTRKKVAAACGGAACAGESSETKTCEKCCPQNCKWGPWNDWSECQYANGKCGVGKATRTREVEVEASCGGRKCVGKNEDVKRCQTCCPRDCQWKHWSDWGDCRFEQGTCGVGTSKRTRGIAVPALCGGAECDKDEGSEQKPCEKCCPQNCKWGPWKDWSDCKFANGKCGVGKATRTRDVELEATCGGRKCVGKSEDIKRCRTCCPKDCQWKPWSDWSNCRFKQGNCGEGVSKRTRKNVPASCGGNVCTGDSTETKQCEKCCPQNCKWGPWKDWSDCQFANGKCGVGKATRTREVEVEASCGGKKCPGKSEDVKRCQTCCPRDCQWKLWSDWGDCRFEHGTCGVGTSKRTRGIAVPAVCGGAKCDKDEASEHKPCEKCCPQDCKWGPWKDWSDCQFANGKCGVGKATRTREVELEASCGGRKCVGKSEDIKRCRTCCPKDCQWKPWSDWSNCRFKQGNCGEGVSKRTRNNVPASCGGNVCIGDSTETKQCEKCCPQNCKWGPWKDWSDCQFANGKCGVGKATRTREVEVEASCGGKKCPGKSEDVKRCQTCCPRDCQWKLWSDWGDCRFEHGTCGVGTSKRTRGIALPALCGGAECDKDEGSEQKPCEKCCPQNCKFGEWGDWGKCKYFKRKCGDGLTSRERQIEIPASCGGDSCEGPLVESKNCHKCCPVCCEWDKWSKWSSCNYFNGQCGDGNMTRTRVVKVEAKCGGDKCRGKPVDTHDCHKCCPRDCKL